MTLEKRRPTRWKINPAANNDKRHTNRTQSDQDGLLDHNFKLKWRPKPAENSALCSLPIHTRNTINNITNATQKAAGLNHFLQPFTHESNPPLFPMLFLVLFPMFVSWANS